MNPFALPGPQFLFFFAVFAGAVILVIHLLRRSATADDTFNVSDPYAIAFLRGGESEVLRVVAASLIDRGLLQIDGDNLYAPDRAAISIARRPIERKMLEFFSRPRPPIFGDELRLSARTAFEDDLAARGLIARLHVDVWLGVAAIVAVAATKIAIALWQGRTNVAFLILATILACSILMGMRPRLTARGKKTLRALEGIYGGLKSRAHTLRPGGASNELAILAAVFGMTALPSVTFAATRSLLAPPPAIQSAGSSSWSSSDSSGSSCGASSCGSSSCGSSSCGSSCGGGCGGGCGGCGG